MLAEQNESNTDCYSIYFEHMVAVEAFVSYHVDHSDDVSAYVSS